MRQLIERLLATPYLPGGFDWTGADCWGVVEIWYRERFGIVLTDRGRIEPTPLGVMAGYELSSAWMAGAFPRDDDLILMRARWNGETIQHGHIGVYWGGTVLHSQPDHGCACQPYRARHIESRVTAILRHRSLA